MLEKLEIFRNSFVTESQKLELDLSTNQISSEEFHINNNYNNNTIEIINKVISYVATNNQQKAITYVQSSLLNLNHKKQLDSLLNSIAETNNEPSESLQQVIKNKDRFNISAEQYIELKNDITLIKESINKAANIDATIISETVYTRLKQYVDDSNPPAPTDTTSEIDVANFLREFKETNLNALTALETKLSTIVNNVELNVSNTTKQVANIQLKISQQENNKQSIDNETKLVTSQMVEFTKKADLNKLTENLNIMARYTQNFNLQAGRMCGKIAQLMNVDIKKRAYFIIGSFFFICIASTTVSYAVVKLPAPKAVLDAATAKKVQQYDNMTRIYNNMSTADQKQFAKLMQITD